ncbi:MAG: Bax inhibitor-1/YccA family protein [Candidatus Dependentiae bacterium]|nr:Bax inhibitor-1/YccA family protein [Candidatus Dependentiae bacterium]
MENRYYAASYSSVQNFLYRVFGWMSFALVVSGITAYFIGTSEALLQMIMANTGIVIGLVIAQFLLVIVLSAAIRSLSRGAAFVLFSLYAVLTGMTLSSIFAVYSLPSIAMTFFVAAGMFAAMAVYGLVTKRDLSAMGSIMIMALFGIIIASVVNMFLKSAPFNLAIAFIGVIVFAGLTAWDLQNIKRFAQQVDVEDEGAANVALSAALSLYLDFINLFLSLLQLMGERRK